MTEANARAVVERSRVRVEALPGRTKAVTLPLLSEPVLMGVHGPVAAHYKVPMDEVEPRTTTLDYLVGAAVGCLTGTFAGMLAALGQRTADGALVAEGESTIVSDGGVLRIAAIAVHYALRLDAAVDEQAVRRAHDRHLRHCPIAHSIGGCIEFTSHLNIERGQ
ncbi:OsmC family protein [Streptomyces sp. NPDC085932]|uniref:OsmC family protein n=1 Tax=Streptomyces sp. NPDC085932 TaxID=3365741 RepID=UPI0037D3F8C5